MLRESAQEPDPLDADDDLYSALAMHDDWYMQGDDGELFPIGREQVAQALAWRRRLAERD